jgi:hypothetical protein
MGEFRATLYDLFGYLLPGLVVLGAVSLFFSAIGPTQPSVSVADIGSPSIATIIVICAYLLGHAVHALGNALQHLVKSPESRFFLEEGLPTDLVGVAREMLGARLGVSLKEVPPGEFCALVDETRVVRDKAGDRAVYVYREGFYRGMVVASAFLGTAVLALISRGGITISLSADSSLFARRVDLLVLLVLTIGCGAGFFFRMLRFGRYRVQRALYQFLISATEK